jgi:hypothetical protein
VRWFAHILKNSQNFAGGFLEENCTFMAKLQRENKLNGSKAEPAEKFLSSKSHSVSSMLVSVPKSTGGGRSCKNSPKGTKREKNFERSIWLRLKVLILQNFTYNN